MADIQRGESIEEATLVAYLQRAQKQSDPEARVVMVSAVDQKEKLAECIRSGAVDFIVKPFDKARLRGFFDKYLARDDSTLP